MDQVAVKVGDEDVAVPGGDARQLAERQAATCLLQAENMSSTLARTRMHFSCSPRPRAGTQGSEGREAEHATPTSGAIPAVLTRRVAGEDLQ